MKTSEAPPVTHVLKPSRNISLNSLLEIFCYTHIPSMKSTTVEIDIFCNKQLEILLKLKYMYQNEN